MDREELFAKMKSNIDELELKLKERNEQEQAVFEAWDKVNKLQSTIEVDVRTSDEFRNEKSRDAEVTRRRYENPDLTELYSELNVQKKQLAHIDAEITALKEILKAYKVVYGNGVLL